MEKEFNKFKGMQVSTEDIKVVKKFMEDKEFKSLSEKVEIIKVDGFCSCEGYFKEDVKEFIEGIADKCFAIDGFSTDGKARIVVDIEDVKELAGNKLIE